MRNNNETEEMTNEQSRDITARNTKSKYAKQTMYLGLVDWCKNNSQFPSSDDDKPFLIDCNFHVDKKTNKFDRINIAITTNRLLNLVLKRPDILICDATYKIVWQGFSVIVVGIIDYAKKFHPIVMAINETDKTEDHKFVLEALSDYILVLNEVEYNPQYILSDSRENRFSHVFIDGAKRIVFWLNVIKAVDRRLRRIREKSHRKLIRADIIRIRLSGNEFIFAKAVELFESKWRGKYEDDEIDKFVDYFKDKWCSDGNCGWYEGFSICNPEANDRLKATINLIHMDMTVSEFLNMIAGEEEGIVKKWSTDRNPHLNSLNNIEFHEQPMFTLVDELLAWRWDQKGKQIRSARVDGEELFFTPAGGDQTQLEHIECFNFVNSLINLPFRSLDELSTQTKKIHVIRLNRENWKMSSCSCSDYVECYICVHIIATAVRNNFHVFDPRAKQPFLGKRVKEEMN